MQMQEEPGTGWGTGPDGCTHGGRMLETSAQGCTYVRVEACALLRSPGPALG